MRHLITSVRPGERFTTVVAFMTLMLIMTGHAVMETARDALFLSTIPASRLPWVYLGIAAVALVVQKFESQIPTNRLQLVLAGWLSIAAIVTFGFWVGLPFMGSAGLYALYIWSGTMASIVLVHFWTLLSNYVTVVDAKRLFSVIGVGSALGAIAGSGLAAAISMVIETRHLLLVTVAMMLVAMVGPYLLARFGGQPIEKEQEGESEGLLASLKTIAGRPYIKRVAGLVILATLTVTLVDIVFKSIAAERVPDDQLAAFFGVIYLVLNVVSLGVQVFLVGPIVRRFSVTGALVILPGMLAAAAASVLLGGGLPAAIALKGADGSLRHSLHRTALELLYVPLSNKIRLRVKSVIDVIAQRFGQALGSVLFLGGVALGVERESFVAATILFAVAWVATAVSLKTHYLDLFRNVLNTRSVQIGIDHPDLDIGSLETLLLALNSEDDSRVLAAMSLLAEEKKTHVIPALVLYHPSTQVVLRALELFIEAERDDYFSVAERIESDAPPEVKAAVLAAVATRRHDSRMLFEKVDSNDPALSTTAKFLLVLRGEWDREEFDVAFRQVVREGTRESRLALIQAIGTLRAEECGSELITLLYSTDLEVRKAALKAMVKVRLTEFIEPICDLIADRRLRNDAIGALVAFGDPALEHLRDAIADPHLAPKTRWPLPRAIGAFDTEVAADILVHTLPDEEDGMVRYRIVRELERLRLKNPKIRLNKNVLRRSVEATLIQAYRLMDWQITVERNLAEREELRTDTSDILLQMIKDKGEHAVDILIRQVGLLYPREDFAGILRGMKSSNPQRRASSRELLEHAVPHALQGAVMALVDDAPATQRVEAAKPLYHAVRLSYEELLTLMVDGESETLRLLAVHHVGELGMHTFVPALQALEKRANRSLRTIVERALERLIERSMNPSLGA